MVEAKPLRFFIRTNEKKIWRINDQEATTTLAPMVEEPVAETAKDEGFKTLEKLTGEEVIGEKTEELHLNSSGENNSERTVVLQDNTPLDIPSEGINNETTEEPIQEL